MFDEATYETIEMPFDDMLEIIIKACRTNLPPELYFKGTFRLYDHLVYYFSITFFSPKKGMLLYSIHYN